MFTGGLLHDLTNLGRKKTTWLGSHNIPVDFPVETSHHLGLVVDLPLWKIWVRHLGLWNSQHMESHRIPWFQTTSQNKKHKKHLKKLIKPAVFYSFLLQDTDFPVDCWQRFQPKLDPQAELVEALAVDLRPPHHAAWRGPWPWAEVYAATRNVTSLWRNRASRHDYMVLICSDMFWCSDSDALTKNVLLLCICQREKTWVLTQHISFSIHTSRASSSIIEHYTFPGVPFRFLQGAVLTPGYLPCLHISAPFSRPLEIPGASCLR